MMTAMVILVRCRRALERKRALDERERRLRDSASNVVPHYDNSGAGGGAYGDAMAALMAQLDALAQERAAEQRVYATELAAANLALDVLSRMERTVLYRYYIAGQSVTGIAKALDRTRGTVQRIKSRGSLHAKSIQLDMPDWYLCAVGDDVQLPRTGLVDRLNAVKIQNDTPMIHQ